MKISTILVYIDSGDMALPEFQRGFVWNRNQVRGLFDSLYRRHPVGGLLVWATKSGSTAHRGTAPTAAGTIKLLLDGQQRMTSLYGVMRGKPPKFFDGNPSVFTGLRFHLDSEVFEFYQPIKMKDDVLWIDVSELMRRGNDGVGAYVQLLAEFPEHAPKLGIYMGRLNKLLGIGDIDLHVEEVTGDEMTLDVVVDIFNRVNSGGTKLSKGDLALAKICAEWPEGRETMKAKLAEWSASGYQFSIDWLLRSVNTVLTGEARFLYLHEKHADEVKDALAHTSKYLDSLLNLIAGRLGLDHDRVLFGRFGIPVMARYLELRRLQGEGSMSDVERDKLLFWYVQAAMWGRFSGSTESFIDQDLEALQKSDGGLNALLEQLRLWHGGLRAEPGHFTGWSLGARFYPVLYMLTRMGASRDLAAGGNLLNAHMLGKMSHLEVHHIFPKAQLYKAGYKRPDVNALGNFCFLTKDANLEISDRLPEEYFIETEAKYPGALASQWIPTGDPALWKIENFGDFLEARKKLLADELNARMVALLHGEAKWLGSTAPVTEIPVVPGGIGSDEEETALHALNTWVTAHGLPLGTLEHELTDSSTAKPSAVLDLAWPRGLQEGLSEPVAVLLNEEPDLLKIASEAGFRCFSDGKAFKKYVQHEVLGAEVTA